ncbi:MAG: immunoglobulin domain-containing protein, partial [Verrucomicrobia bacterium]|nr:immunoglobulin domain-containing protein [Verrucomicrobiota bacterium]
MRKLWPAVLAGSALLLGAGGLRAAPQLRFETAGGVATQPFEVVVTLDSEGAENAVGFSVGFDSSRLRLESAVAADPAAGHAYFINVSRADEGRVGAVFSRPAGESFAPGAHPLLRLTFRAGETAGAVPLAFEDDPVRREAVGPDGAAVPANFANGAATIAPLAPPQLTEEPADQEAYLGANAIFYVGVESAAPVTYQWFKEGAPIAGADAVPLVLRRVRAEDAGRYRVEARNGAGAVMSREAVLTVREGLRPGLIGQWDFDHGDLRASVGEDLEYLGDTEAHTEFLSDQIAGREAQVMGFPKAARSQGYRGRIYQANGGGSRLNQYTLLFDVKYPAASDRKWRALLQTDPSNGNDAEFYVGTGNGIGINGVYQGEVQPERWHRLAFVVDQGAGTLRKFIDGTLVGTQSLSGGVDGRWSIGSEFLLFTENNGETEAGFVNSVQLYSHKLSDAQVAELGAPAPEGLPKGMFEGLRPTILSQPLSQTVREGEAVTLEAVARGTPPLRFQWLKEEAELPGATNVHLLLPAVTAAQTGGYRLVVANDLGATTSRVAVVALSAESRVLSFEPTDFVEGAQGSVALQLRALGGEHALGCTALFDPEALRYVGLAGEGGASVMANVSRLGEGRLGVLWSLPPGQALPGGEQRLCRILFEAIGKGDATPLDFAEEPIALELTDVGGHARQIETQAGSAGLLHPPRITAQPETTAGAPGGSVAFNVGVWGTEPLQFQWRKDGESLPGATNQVLVLTNVQPAQAGLYSVVAANAVGSATSEEARLVVGRLARVGSRSGFVGETFEVPVEMFGLGDEAAAALSLRIDPAAADLLEVIPGAALTGGGSLLVNTNLLSEGWIGLSAALGAGSVFPEGWSELARLRIRASAPVAASAIETGDSPVAREVVGGDATPLPAVFLGGEINVTERPPDPNLLPDLSPTSIVAPAEVGVGLPIELRYTVSNQSTQTVHAPWREAIYLARSPDGSGRQLIAMTTVGEDLPAMGSAERAQTLVLPAAEAGTRYLMVQVDVQNEIAEKNEGNNRAIRPEPILIRAPDLIAGPLVVPSEATPGQAILIQWGVTNQGSRPTGVPWVDRIWLVPGNAAAEEGEALATVDAPAAALAPGEGYTNAVTVTIPLDRDHPPGAYRVVVDADFGNGVPELSEGNNRLAAPIELRPPPLPDLTVVSVEPVGEAEPGEPLTVRWTVRNRGTIEAAPPWREEVSLVHSTLGARPIGFLEITNVLPAGGEAAREATFLVPGDIFTGEARTAVQADVRDEVLEEREDNNQLESAGTVRIPRRLTLDIPVAEMREDANPPTVQAVVARSGERTAPVTVTLENSDP